MMATADLLRVLVVDDEAPARRKLLRLLRDESNVEIVGEADNAEAAIGAIEKQRPDLVFVDVQMPGADGFDVVRAISANGNSRGVAATRFVFVTAHDQYAVRAFEVHALDYVLKPIDDERLASTLRHVRSTITGTRDGGYERQLARALGSLAHAAARPAIGSDRMAIPDGNRIMVIRVGDIDWIQASDNYVSINIGKKTWLLRDTISAMERRLAACGFLRIHRSTIVNTQRVTELRSLTNGDFAVVLGDGPTLRLSKTYRSALEQFVGNGL